MKVTNFFKLTKEGAVRAFFDVALENGMTVKEFRYVEGKKGPFVSVPSREYIDREGVKKYKHIVELTPFQADELLKQAKAIYGGGDASGDDWFGADGTAV
jgi:DNA-binding cell septation regulator SpoVG